jgi:hypothetical protein
VIETHKPWITIQPPIPEGEINVGIWTSLWEETQIWASKLWPWVPQDSDTRISVLVMPISNCKLQTKLIVREGAPHQQTRNCLKII